MSLIKCEHENSIDGYSVVEPQAIHIDTVKLRHTFAPSRLPSQDELEEIGGESIRIKKASGLIISEVSFRPTREDSVEPFIKIVWLGDEYAYIDVEVSLAKIIDGNGLGRHSNADICAALALIEKIVYEKLGVPFQVRTAKVVRLDVNADFYVGENLVRPMIMSTTCDDSRLKAMAWEKDSKLFKSKSRSLKVYDKKEELLNKSRKRKASRQDVEQATGIFRVEISLLSSAIKELTKKLKIENQASRILNLSIAEVQLEKAIKKLNLNLPKVSEEGVELLMIQRFGREAPRMLGYWHFRRLVPDYKRLLRLSKATDYRIRMRLKKEGLLDGTSGTQLPALRIIS